MPGTSASTASGIFAATFFAASIAAALWPSAVAANHRKWMLCG